MSFFSRCINFLIYFSSLWITISIIFVDRTELFKESLSVEEVQDLRLFWRMSSQKILEVVTC